MRYGYFDPVLFSTPAEKAKIVFCGQNQVIQHKKGKNTHHRRHMRNRKAIMVVQISIQ